MFKKKKKEKGTFEKEFEYMIGNARTDKTYREQCARLKNGIDNLIDDGVSTSEDGSVMRFFLYRDMEITVLYDIELQEVYVSSPIDISTLIIEPFE